MSKTIKTTYQQISDIIGVIDGTAAPASITGEVRRNARRLSSSTEDIVVMALTVDADQFQGGVYNVNIHVSNLTEQMSGVPNAVDRTQPNELRMQEIASMIVPALDGHHGEDFALKLRNPGKLEGYGTEWLYNIVVEYEYIREDL